ncbi:hypothetical protein AGMMS49960_15600 [Betaproteobacteria bacterium]|nr:hypothetical protein AGMMS49960_15600 [Betaproteobacteria bacterium]
MPGLFVGMERFIDIGIFTALADAENQHIKLHADLVQQLAAARAGRCEVDVRLAGGHGGKDVLEYP